MAKKRQNRWQQRQANDHYVKQAQSKGFRSRAAFKLMEINEKDRLFRPGMTVVDLGAAPGGWSQIAAQQVGSQGRVIALDVLRMDALAGVEFIQGDFTEQNTLEKLRQHIGLGKVDLVLSDMAPNISGMKSVDQPRSVYLAELALELASEFLNDDGDFLVKVFQGEGIDAYRQHVRQRFCKLLTRKPNSSRSESREFYLLGRNRIV